MESWADPPPRGPRSLILQPFSGGGVITVLTFSRSLWLPPQQNVRSHLCNYIVLFICARHLIIWSAILFYIWLVTSISERCHNNETRSVAKRPSSSEEAESNSAPNKMADGLNQSHFGFLCAALRPVFDPGDLIEWNMPCSDCNFIKVATLGALAVVVHHSSASWLHQSQQLMDVFITTSFFISFIYLFIYFHFNCLIDSSNFIWFVSCRTPFRALNLLIISLIASHFSMNYFGYLNDRFICSKFHYFH